MDHIDPIRLLIITNVEDSLIQNGNILFSSKEEDLQYKE